jgi:serine/threonine-protein kinase
MMRSFAARSAARAPRRVALLSAAIAALVAASAAAQPPAGHYPYFPADSEWTRDVSNAALDLQSATVINWLASQSGGWGSGVMRIDFSIEVLEANAATPFRAFAPKRDEDEFYDPDCDETMVPLPPGGALEGESGYACASDGDCHLIVVHRPSSLLFEMWRADVIGPGPSPNDFPGGCLAVWDLRNTYQPTGRGQDCTSADGAGFPIAPLLFNADEVAAGHIDHAIRFILPNSRIRDNVYVHPATHSTGPTSGPPQAPPYGTRLRLRADYPLASLDSEAERTIARAMQKYGILLSDGGTLALTAQSDRFTTAKWDDLLPGNIQYALDELLITDFQMVDGGTRYTWTGDCARTYPVFNDGFEVPILPKWNGKSP